jgi:biopolymer transport protein ExbD
MSRFRKNVPKVVPSLNTTSLPDLIFTLLFFFLLVVNMRSTPVLTQYQLPAAAELQKLKDKSLLIYIMVGETDGKTAIQLNSTICSLEEMPDRLNAQKEDLSPETRDKITVVLKIDKHTPMGLVNDIRQILRETNLLTVYYAAENYKE